MRPDTAPFLNELTKLAYGWDAIKKVSSMAKKIMFPKAMRTKVDKQIGAAMGTKGGRAGTYAAGKNLFGEAQMLTPGSGGTGRALRRITVSKSFTEAPGRTPYQQAAIEALKRTKMTGPQQRALDSVTHGHELDELAIGTRRNRKHLGLSPVTRKLNHYSPDVLFREHNRLVTLPPEVRGGVADVAKKLRAATGDSEAIENGFKGRFNFGDSPRLSRHARKRMTESLERRYVPEAD